MLLSFIALIQNIYNHSVIQNSMITEKQKLILKLLLGNKEGYNVNQIARLLHISVSWVHESLKLLENEGYVKSEKSKNSLMYKVNWKSPKAVKLSEFILIEDSERVPQKVYLTDYKLIRDVAKVVEQEMIDKADLLQDLPNEEDRYGLANPRAFEDAPAQSVSYNVAKEPEVAAQGSPYAQAGGVVASGSNFYGVNPIGDQGVNNVLGMYGTSGVSPTSAYATNSPSAGNYGSSGAASPGTIEATVSKLVGNYNYAQHTAHLSSGAAQGCRYCGTI